jgi:hypothetical protein
VKRAIHVLALILVGFIVGIWGLRSPNSSPTSSTANRLGPSGPAEMGQEANLEGPVVSEAVTPGSSPAVRDLPPLEEELPALNREINPLHNPWSLLEGNIEHVDEGPDPLAFNSVNGGDTPPLDFSFEGTGNPVGCGGCSPPDTNGDVGPNHYVHSVNVTKIAIYDKAGTLLEGPFNLSTLWTSGTCASNIGDPVVVYDSLADRWLLSQFGNPTHMCIAISQTPDPTGAYHTYTFNVLNFPDYFKFGVWPDGYYMSANDSAFRAYAFDRDQMLAGQAATYQRFNGTNNFLLPADVDGPTPPPAGAPNIFYTHKDNSFHGGVDRIDLYAFHVDWDTPANSTFTLEETLPISAFTYTACGFFNFNCVYQLGTAQRFSSIGEFPMFRLVYRNFDNHETLLGSFIVGGGLGEVGSALRWFELRNTGSGWSIYQESTYDPDDGHDRFNSSIAMDRAGNIALGFSLSSSAIHPSIHYTVRYADDPLGTMRTEAVMLDGTGSQTGSNRWGDYSSMSVDPADDCTFWYTNQYYATNSPTAWKTRIGVFTIPGCSSPDFTMSATPEEQLVCTGDVATYDITLGAVGGFNNTVTLSAEGHPAGTTATFDPTGGVPPLVSTLTIDDTDAAAPGEYAIDIVGESVTSTHTTTVQLDVATTLAAPNLTAPADGATNQPLQPTFTWSAVPGAGSYIIEFATDPDFNNILYSDDVAVPTYTPAAPFDYDTTLYWRVATANICGTGEFSEPYSFTTEIEIIPGVDVPADLSDSGAPGAEVVYSITVTNTGNFTDTFTISVAGNSWTTDAPPATGPLAPGESTVVEVTVTVGDGKTDSATVTFTSDLDDSVTDAVTLTTTAEISFEIYLPVIVGND